MADLQKIMRTCKRCGGGGEETIGSDKDGNPLDSITCRKCEGDGEISTSSLHPDLIDLFNDMANKINDIKQKVDEL